LFFIELKKKGLLFKPLFYCYLLPVVSMKGEISFIIIEIARRSFLTPRNDGTGVFHCYLSFGFAELTFRRQEESFFIHYTNVLPHFD